MTRRLVVTLLCTVLATLVVAAAVTVGLARWQARETTADRLREQASTLVETTDLAAGPDATPRERQITRRVLRELRTLLRIEGVEFVRIDPAGAVMGALPDGVTAADLDTDALQRGETTSGADGSTVWAAAPRRAGQAIIAAVVVADADTELATAATWFAVAAAVTIAVGAVAAVVLGRRLARPIRDASAAAHRLAGGELDTRLPDPPPSSDDELADLARSINTMASGLERSRALEHQFLLSVSHDLRTPLAAIRGWAEAVVDGAAPSDRDAAVIIVSEADRLERLVADLLTLARLDSRSFPLHPVELDLREPVADAVRAFGPTAARAGLAVTVEDPAAAVASVDPERVRQVLGNLLDNAARYARSTIEVAVVDGAGSWVIRVDDDGPGISADDLAHVFERLYVARAQPLREEVGSGLGLAIVHQLVDAMGGSVRVDRAPVGGARFDVSFPAATTPAPPLAVV